MNRSSYVTLSSLALICIMFVALKGDDPSYGYRNSKSESFNAAVDSKLLNINNISTWFRNNGNFNRDPATQNAGFEWPKGSGKYARYASGLWMGCTVGNDTLTAVAEYSYDYLPGYVDGSGNPQGMDDPLYRIYSIQRGDTTSADYQDWPVSQGAYTNEIGRPFFLGTQTMFYVYTDAYPHSSGSTSLASLKAQILQTNWSYTNIGLKDVAFTEFRVINRSGQTWNNVTLSYWTDDDLGDGNDDAIGCDTNRNLGFTYNATDNDPSYGIAPPSVGTTILRSPITFTGNSADTVKYYSPPGSQNLIVKAGYRFTGMNVFNTYNNTSPPPADPSSNAETFRVINGLWRTGESWTNPTNGQFTKKVYSGDPVTGTGWIMSGLSDRRFLQSFGPFTMNANDTQSIIIAQLIGRGSSNLNSITVLKNLSDYVQTIYDNNFQSVLAVNKISTEIPSSFSLGQNYPNPFNPSTVINYKIASSDFITLKVFDMSGKEIMTLVNMKQEPGTYSVDFNGANLSSGIYYYNLKAGDFSETRKMIMLK
ncbi:MAG: T9SS type A sorting domain-containing protein [Ignavibacteria bacterium]